MTPFFMMTIGVLMIGFARFIKFFGMPAPVGLVLALVGLLLVIVGLVVGTYPSRR